MRPGADASICRKCGAKRVDQQIGLEPSPETFVANLVEVFREVRRVLARHGTCWINLGSSYASGDMSPSPSPQPKHALACDIDGKELQGSLQSGLSYRDLCDGCRDVIESHHDNNVDNGQLNAQSEQPSLQIGHDNARLDCASELHLVSPDDVPASTNQKSSEQPPAGCCHCANCGVCLSVLGSSSRDARLCARREEYRNGIARTELESRTPNMDASGMAWMNYTSKLKPKDMVPIPWMIAMALQEDGWYLRRDVIWEKTDGMPESARDRPTSMHEYIFMFTKSGYYYWDRDAAQEPAAWERWGRQTNVKGAGWITSEPIDLSERDTRNIRSVWRGKTANFSEAHFAVMPLWIVERCINLSSKPSDIILDPFGGAGTTALAARNLLRKSVLIELSEEHCVLIAKRLQQLSLLTS